MEQAQTPAPRVAAMRLFRAYPGQTVAVIGLTFLSGLAEAVGVLALLPLLGLAGEVEAAGMPEFADLVADALAVVGLEATIGTLLAIIVAGIGGKVVLKIVAMRQAGYAAALVAQDLRLGLIEGLMTARWGYFTSQPVGRLANAVSSEAQRASQVFTKSTDLVARVVQVAIYLVLAMLVSWQIATVTLALGVAMVATLRSLVTMARRAGRQQTALLRSLITRLSDGLYAIKPLKAMARERSLRPLLEQETRELGGAQRRLVLSKAVLDNAHEVIVAAFVAVIVFVLLELLGFPFTHILFVAFLFYRTATYLGKLQSQYQGLMEAESAYWSIQEAVDAARGAREVTGGRRAPALERGIRFEGVTFSYGGEDAAPVLDGCDVDIPAGRFTAAVGPSGVGKTTLVDLAVGLYRPTAGAVLVDGVDLADIDLHSWRQRIGYVPQELILFHDSVRANVAMGDERVTDADVEQALRDAGAWAFVEALPEGLDTLVGEHGTRLSGGQRQRLAIARALVRKPALLILDEATTALDPDTERAILSTLDGLKGRVTMLAISHQAGIVETADQVVRLEPSDRGAHVTVEAPQTGSAPSRGRDRSL